MKATYAELEKLARDERMAELGADPATTNVEIKLQNEIMKIKSNEADKYKENLACTVHIASAMERYLNMLEELEADLCVVWSDSRASSTIESKFIPRLAAAKKRLAEVETAIADFEAEEALVSKKIEKVISGKEHREVFEIMASFEKLLVKNLLLKTQLVMEDFTEQALDQNFNLLIGKAKEDRSMGEKLLRCQHKLSDELEELKREAHRSILLAVGLLHRRLTRSSRSTSSAKRTWNRSS